MAKFSPNIAFKIFPKLINLKKLVTIFSKIGLADANKGTTIIKQSKAIVTEEKAWLKEKSLFIFNLLLICLNDALYSFLVVRVLKKTATGARTA